MNPTNKEAQIALPATSPFAGGKSLDSTGLNHPRLIDVGQCLQDKLNSKCLDIIDQAFAIAQTAAELSNAPTSAEVAHRLKELARLLKRSCNRLTYELARRPRT